MIAIGITERSPCFVFFRFENKLLVANAAHGNQGTISCTFISFLFQKQQIHTHPSYSFMLDLALEMK